MKLKNSLYWYINDVGVVIKEKEPYSNSIDGLARKRIGNYFETKEEAEQVAEKLKVWIKTIRLNIRDNADLGGKDE